MLTILDPKPAPGRRSFSSALVAFALAFASSSTLASALVGCARHDVRFADVELARRAPDGGASSGLSAPGAALVPVLDVSRGARAEAAYGAFEEQLCAMLAARPKERRAVLERVGLDGDAQPQCAPASGADSASAVASGSFTSAGVDEVLVQVPSGLAWAQGDTALALMRHDGTSYQLVEHLLIGKGYTAVARIARDSSRDVLMLCEDGGHMGLYPRTCGFLGEGSFTSRRGASAATASASASTSRSDGSEVEMVTIATCGPSTNVTLGRVSLASGTLRVVLVVEDVVSRRAPDDPDTPYDCSDKAVVRTRSFPLEYRAVGDAFVRVTPIPAAVTEVLERY